MNLRLVVVASVHRNQLPRHAGGVGLLYFPSRRA